jgi:hypothetical protein
MPTTVLAASLWAGPAPAPVPPALATGRGPGQSGDQAARAYTAGLDPVDLYPTVDTLPDAFAPQTGAAAQRTVAVVLS